MWRKRLAPPHKGGLAAGVGNTRGSAAVVLPPYGGICRPWWRQRNLVSATISGHQWRPPTVASLAATVWRLLCRHIGGGRKTSLELVYFDYPRGNQSTRVLETVATYCCPEL